MLGFEVAGLGCVEVAQGDQTLAHAPVEDLGLLDGGDPEGL